MATAHGDNDIKRKGNISLIEDEPPILAQHLMPHATHHTHAEEMRHNTHTMDVKRGGRGYMMCSPREGLRARMSWQKVVMCP